MTSKETLELQTRPGFEGIDVSADGDTATSGPRIAKANPPAEDFEMSAPAKPAPSGVRRNVPASPVGSTPPQASGLTTTADIGRPAKQSVVSGFRRLATDALRKLFGEAEAAPMPDDILAEALSKCRDECRDLLAAWERHEAFAVSLAQYSATGAKQARSRLLAELSADPTRADEIAGRLAGIAAVTADPHFDTAIRFCISRSIHSLTPAVDALLAKLTSIHAEFAVIADRVDLVSANIVGEGIGAARRRVDTTLLPLIGVLREERDPTRGGVRPVGHADSPGTALRLARQAVGNPTGPNQN